MKQWITEFFKRFGMETPSFFQVLQNIAIACGIIVGLPTILVQFETSNFILPPLVHLLVQKSAIWAAAVLWIVAKLPVKPNTTTMLTKDKKLPFTTAKDSGNMVKMLLPIIGLLALTSCKITRPIVSEKQQQAITQAIMHTNDLYEDMANSYDKNYATYADRYTDILNEIDQIITRDNSRPGSAKLYQQDLLIQTAWNNRISYHIQKGTLTETKIRAEQAYMKSLWDPRRIAEYSLSK